MLKAKALFFLSVLFFIPVYAVPATKLAGKQFYQEKIQARQHAEQERVSCLHIVSKKLVELNKQAKSLKSQEAIKENAEYVAAFSKARTALKNDDLPFFKKSRVPALATDSQVSECARAYTYAKEISSEYDKIEMLSNKGH